MIEGLITIYNSLLYYCCLLILARYVLLCLPKKAFVPFSFIIFIPLTILIISENTTLLYPFYILFLPTQFFLIKLAFPKIKLYYLTFFYILLYCINLMFTSLITTIIPQYSIQADFFINTTTAAICILLSLCKTRFALRQAIEWTPKHIWVISTLLLVVATIASVLVSAFHLSLFPEVWTRFVQIITAFLLMAICIVVPIIFLISISNTRLKSLTADYEQQIYAQAEHYKELAVANYEVRRFHHDFKNMRIAIETLITEGHSEQALQLLQECSNALVTPDGKLHFDTGNGIADALLKDKQARAIDHGTSIVFEGAIPSDFLSPTDLCVILGNTLDNAIDACCKLPTQQRKNIVITSACNSGFLFLTVTNPISEKVQIHNNHIATTKDNKTLHGFGLYSLQSVIKKYDGDLLLSATDDCFTVNIDLCLSKSQNALYNT